MPCSTWFSTFHYTLNKILYEKTISFFVFVQFRTLVGEVTTFQAEFIDFSSMNAELESATKL